MDRTAQTQSQRIYQKRKIQEGTFHYLYTSLSYHRASPYEGRTLLRIELSLMSFLMLLPSSVACGGSLCAIWPSCTNHGKYPSQTGWLTRELGFKHELWPHDFL